MSTFALAAYVIRVRGKDGKDDYRPLQSFDGKHDLLDVVFRLFARMKAFTRNEKKKAALQIARLNRNNRTLTGILETGAYGFESNLKDAETGTLVHRRGVKEADMLPFYYRFYLPTNEDRGIVLLQRFKLFGVRSLIWSNLLQDFATSFPDYVLEMAPLMPEEVARELTRDGRVRRIRLLRYGLPRAIEDQVDGKIDKNPGETELSITVGRGKSFPQQLMDDLSAMLRGEREPGAFSMGALVDNFEYDRLKLEFDAKAMVRTVDLKDIGKIRAHFPIDDDIEVTPGGHPTYQSLDAVAKDILVSLGRRVLGDSVDFDV